MYTRFSGCEMKLCIQKQKKKRRKASIHSFITESEREHASIHRTKRVYTASSLPKNVTCSCVYSLCCLPKNVTCSYVYSSIHAAIYTRFLDVTAMYTPERWGAGVETQKNVRGDIRGWGRVPFNETYAPSLSTIYDGA